MEQHFLQQFVLTRPASYLIDNLISVIAVFHDTNRPEPKQCKPQKWNDGSEMSYSAFHGRDNSYNLMCGFHVASLQLIR